MTPPNHPFDFRGDPTSLPERIGILAAIVPIIGVAIVLGMGGMADRRAMFAFDTICGVWGIGYAGALAFVVRLVARRVGRLRWFGWLLLLAGLAFLLVWNWFALYASLGLLPVPLVTGWEFAAHPYAIFALLPWIKLAILKMIGRRMLAERLQPSADQ